MAKPPSPEIELISTEPGAYLLSINVSKQLLLEIASLSVPTLASGRYVYCGSAYDPGGIRARVRRHLRRDKSVRWHADCLTMAGRVSKVAVLVGGSECALMEGLRTLPGITAPVPSFASYYCRACPSHLAAVPKDFDIARFISGFRSPI
jgi:Uri superfamily endonuclease